MAENLANQFKGPALGVKVDAMSSIGRYDPGAVYSILNPIDATGANYDVYRSVRELTLADWS